MKKQFNICLLFILTACSDNAVPRGILSADKMQKITSDLLKTDEYINNFVSKDTAVNLKMKRSIFYEQVFKLHNTDRKEFYTSFKYYQQHPDIQKNLFDSVLAILGREKNNSIHSAKPAGPK